MEMDDREQEYRTYLRLHGAPDNATIEALVSLVRDLRNSGQNVRARDLLTDYLNDPLVTTSSNVSVLRARFQLGLVYENLREFRRAEEVWVPLLRESDSAFGPSSLFSGRICNNLANVLLQQRRRRDEQHVLRERALQITKETTGANSLETHRMAAALARSLESQGKWAEAYELNQSALDGLAEHNVPPREYIKCQWAMAGELTKMGKGKEASELFKEVLRQAADLDANDPFRRTVERRRWVFRLLGRFS